MTPTRQRAASPSLFLVGFMGCGKSTVAARLADRFEGGAVDLDRRVERASGRSIGTIFDRDGEAAFRELEMRALVDLPASPPCVVACGAGLWVRAGARRHMRDRGVVVWIDAALPELRRRLGADGERPLWRDQDSLQFRSLFEKRRAIYALADARVKACGPPNRVAAAVFRCFERFFD